MLPFIIKSNYFEDNLPDIKKQLNYIKSPSLLSDDIFLYLLAEQQYFIRDFQNA
jgi:hypothetical protein